MPLSPVSRFIPGAAESQVQALLDVADLTVEVVPVIRPVTAIIIIAQWKSCHHH